MRVGYGDATIRAGIRADAPRSAARAGTVGRRGVPLAHRADRASVGIGRWADRPLAKAHRRTPGHAPNALPGVAGLYRYAWWEGPLHAAPPPYPCGQVPRAGSAVAARCRRSAAEQPLLVRGRSRRGSGQPRGCGARSDRQDLRLCRGRCPRIPDRGARCGDDHRAAPGPRPLPHARRLRAWRAGDGGGPPQPRRR